MLFEVGSNRKLEELDRRLQEAAARHRFGVIAVHDLRQKMRDKGVQFDNDCMIYEVCNPQQAKTVLERNPAISTALPCRISVYTENGHTRLGLIRPEQMLASLSPDPALAEVAREVEAKTIAMVDDAK